MIAMKFIIELDTGLSFLRQAALAPLRDRSQDDHLSSWAVQAIVRPMPAPHRDPGSGPEPARPQGLNHSQRQPVLPIPAIPAR